jgi:integrase
LRVADFGEEQGQRIAVVHGKGGKVARVPLAGTTVGAITDWLQGAGLHAGPVFVPVRRDGGVSLPTSALSRQAAVDIVGAIAARAGLRHIHPHLFRHGAITAALDADVPLHLVQDFARHADPRTTRRYDSHRQSLRNPTAHTLANKLVGKG